MFTHSATWLFLLSTNDIITAKAIKILCSQTLGNMNRPILKAFGYPRKFISSKLNTLMVVHGGLANFVIFPSFHQSFYPNNVDTLNALEHLLNSTCMSRVILPYSFTQPTFCINV